MSDGITIVEGAGIDVGMLVTLAILTICDGMNGSSGEEPSSSDANP